MISRSLIKSLSLILVLLAGLLLMSAPAFAATNTFNGGGITTPATGTAGIANPYPSTISVSGLTGIVTQVTATLSGLTHTCPDDLDIVLVGPTGADVLLMSDSGGCPDVSGVNLTISDAAAGTLPNSLILTTGTFRPSNYSGNDGGTDFNLAPSPTAPYGTTLSVFNGLDPNGTWSLYVWDDQATDIGTFTGWSITVTTVTAPAFTSAAPPAATLGVPYSHTFTASGDPAPTFSLTGTLPAGLTFNAGTATISGTPTAAVTSMGLIATANNGVNPNATQNFDLTVIDPSVAPAITSGAPGSGVVGVPYSHTFTFTGYPAPTASLTGTLPAGLTFDPGTATISGTPTAAGTSTGLLFTAANGVNPDATQSFDLLINPAPAAPTFTSAAPPAATLGVPYSHTFTAIGNPAPTITLTGTLPAGLTFDAGTATLSGTPTTVGTSAGLIATASNGVAPDATQTFDLVVTAVPVAVAAVPTPPPPGLCGDMNGAGNDLLRSNFEHEADRSAVSCRMLAAQGDYMTWLGGQLTQEENIGDTTTLGMGVIGAVDVFNGGSSFVAGVNICLQGSGRMIFLSAADAPRIPREWNAWTTDAFPGFTCTTIWSPGTVVLVGEVGASSAGAAGGDK